MIDKSIVLKGIAASPGKIYGQTLKIITSNHLILETHITKRKVPKEIQRLKNALKKTKLEIENIIRKNSEDIHQEFKDILISQIYMVDDPLLIEGVQRRIEENLENAPLALFHEIDRISNEFEGIDDEYFKERAEDIRDIGRRIENNLLGKRSDHIVLSNLKYPVIIIASELTPSQILHMDKTNVKGIATEKGGKTGHMAILAKYYEIPSVVGIPGLTSVISEDEYILLDGDTGTVVQNPSITQIKDFGPSNPFPKPNELEFETKVCYTLDRERIWIKVNLESELDGRAIKKCGADGVGLFRSEYILLEHPSHSPSEDEQFQIYQKIAMELESKNLVIRTFDVGADKLSSDAHEDNPFLGNRGIRYSLRNPEIFRRQIRAILRASSFGNISILLPMVTQLAELKQAKEIIGECKQELQKKGLKIKNPWLGIMVETPACALSLESFVDDCDFFSIGTNDLLQYFMAVDRNNSLLSNLYNPYNYGFLQTLRKVIDISNLHNIPVSICGELASDIDFTILLIGLGFRELSVALPLVKKIRSLISQIDIPQAYRLAEEVLKLSKNEKYLEIDSFLFNKHYR